MSRLIKIVIGLAIVAALAAGFAWGFIVWHGLVGAQVAEVVMIYAVAVAVASVLFLIGHAFGIRGHGYYVIVGGIVFLGVDFIVWQRLGIMPAVRYGRSGFIPAGILGVFLGPLYRIIAVPARQVTYLH